MSYRVGIDLGGTNIVAGVVDEKYEIIARASCKTNVPRPEAEICDSMAAQVMREGKVQAVVVGADRIAANGDTANKIGTYGVACLAHLHGIPFYVAAPKSTFDLTLATGDAIPIEQRNPEEVTRGFGRQTVPDGVDVYNPAFDVTPAKYIKGIITEFGVVSPVTEENIRAMLGKPAASKETQG